MVPDPNQLANRPVFTGGKSLSWGRTLGEKGRNPSFPFHAWSVSCRAVQKSGVLGNRQSLHSGASALPPTHCLSPFRMIEVLPDLLSWFFSTFEKKNKSDSTQRILIEWPQRSLSILGTWQLIQQNVNPHSSRLKPTILQSSFLAFCLGWAPLEGSLWGLPVPDFPYVQKTPPRIPPSASAIKLCCVPLDFRWAMNHCYILKKRKDLGCWAGHPLKSWKKQHTWS